MIARRDYLKWFLEIANQEYNGSVEKLLSEIDRRDEK